ncbi:MAG TPA: ABC transporter permease [Anaeromyxobacteraceae bacterium]|nr:ABC transporter permease [Anaeromyxobacteraceae bacterium]
MSREVTAEGAAPVQLRTLVAPARPLRSRRSTSTRLLRFDWRRATGLVVPAALLTAWEILSRAGVLPQNWLPPPTAVASTIAGLAREGELWEHVLLTLGRVIAGFLAGSVAATALGIATARSERTRELLDPMLQALRAIPSMGWVPLFLLWFGIGEGSKLALIAVGAFFPVYLNLVTGILALDRRLLEVGQVFRMEGFELVRRVILPATLPAYVSGLRGGLGLAWMFVVAAEIMGASRGLGFLMVDGQSSSRPELILASLILFALLGKATDRGLEALGARWSRWREA